MLRAQFIIFPYFAGWLVGVPLDVLGGNYTCYTSIVNSNWC